MEELNNIVKDYLKQEKTDFSIMINGEWGCGKTYYLCHDFKALIEGIDSYQKPPLKKGINNVFHKDESRIPFLKYKLAYISLYGISSADDFYTRVFYGINKWAKNRWLGFTGTVVSKVAECVGTSINKTDLSAITYIDNHHVLVFDDLERICEDKISFKEVLGLINAFSEQDGRKVVIVCNEKEILDKNPENNENYRSYKEKTIRFSCDISFDAGTIFDSIVSETKDKTYLQYLQSNKDLILKLFKLGGERNLRTLKFFIDIFEKIYQYPDGQYKDKLDNLLVISTLIYVMEYKRNVSVEELKTLKEKFVLSLDNGPQWFKDKVSKEKTDNEPSLSEIVSNRYEFYFSNMIRLPEIVDYIATGFLNEDVLKNSLVNLSAEYKKQDGTPKQRVYSRLQSFNSIKDEEVIPSIKQMLKYVKEGSYNICELLNVYALLLRYDFWHIEKFSITKQIDNLFIKAINETAKDHEYNPAFSMSIPMWDRTTYDTDAYKKYEKLRKIANDINEKSYQNKSKERTDALLEAVVNGDILKIGEFRKDEDMLNLASAMNWNRACDLLEKSPNNIACELIFCIEFMLRHDYHAEMTDLSVLRKWVDEYLKREDVHIRTLYVKELQTQLNEIKTLL